MHPTIQIPLVDWTVQSHNVMVALAALVAAGLGTYWIVRGGRMPAGHVVRALGVIAVFTLVGGRMHFVLANLDNLDSPLSTALRLTSGSLHAPGAVLGAIAGSIFSLRLFKLPIAVFVDHLAPAVGVGIALARMGCLMHGCCFGEHCNLPWAITMPSSSYVYTVQLERGILPAAAARSLPVHPLPAYFATAGIAITLVLLWFRRHKQYDGQLALLLVFLFSLSSAILEPLRIDDPTRIYWGEYPQLLWVTSVMALSSGLLLYVLHYRAIRR